jgi:ArsR family transcriptional regulator, cadmium/lead-responsive transcriptional repressor
MISAITDINNHCCERENKMIAQISHLTALKAKLFRGFADLSRLSLLEALRDGPLTVTALVERTGLTQSNVSNHLACLRDCGLVIASAHGRYTLYQLSDARVTMLLSVASELLSETARGVDACPRYEQKEECC